MKDKYDVSFACVKWGSKYDSDYVNKLYSMVRRNVTKAFNFYCFTDDDANISKDIICVNLKAGLNGWWNKLLLFNHDFHGIKGPIIYLDLDLVITGNIDFLINCDGDFLIIKNWSKNLMYNSSVMRFDAERFSYVWTKFFSDRNNIINRLNGDQEWIFECVPQANFWPEEKIVSYKKSLDSKWLPFLQKTYLPSCLTKAPNFLDTKIKDEISIVIFHGKPDPVDVAFSSYKNWKKASFVSKHWKL